jgi:hypothetical protein
MASCERRSHHWRFDISISRTLSLLANFLPHILRTIFSHRMPVRLGMPFWWSAFYLNYFHYSLFWIQTAAFLLVFVLSVVFLFAEYPLTCQPMPTIGTYRSVIEVLSIGLVENQLFISSIELVTSSWLEGWVVCPWMNPYIRLEPSV